MGLIGIIIVLLIIGLCTWFMYDDFVKRFKRIYKYDINFKDNWKTCGLPLIKLKINGKLEYFLIDSGASVNMIKQSYFDLIMDKPIITKDNKKLHTGSQTIKADLCNFSLSYKNAKFLDETFNIAKLEAFDILKREYGYNIIGIIGSPFMGKYNWSMDFEDLIIWIRKQVKMKDFVGNEIKVGDRVIVNGPYFSVLSEGVISKITPIGATITLNLNDKIKLLRLSKQIIKIQYDC